MPFARSDVNMFSDAAHFDLGLFYLCIKISTEEHSSASSVSHPATEQ